MLGKLVADCLADLRVGLADKIVSGSEAAEVGHGLEVPYNTAWFHAETDYDTLSVIVKRYSYVLVTGHSADALSLGWG